MDRVDVLLQDQDATAMRRLTAALTKVQNWAHEIQFSEPNNTAPGYYLLRDGGDPNAIEDMISGPLGLRSVRFIIDLAIYCGGQAASTPQFDALTRSLGDLWEEVKQVLDDDNNTARSTTGWITSDGWGRSAIRRVDDRLVTECRFTAIWDKTYPAL